MDGLFYALLAPAIWALVNIIDDNLLKDIFCNPYFVTIISALFGFLPLILIPFVTFIIPDISIILLALGAGFILIIDYFYYFKTMSFEQASITAALWILVPALVPILAFFFLGEILTFFQYLGLIIILIASLLFSLIGSKKFKISKSFYYMSIASVLSAISFVMQKAVYNYVNFWTGFILIGFGMGIGGLFYMISFKEGREFIFEIKNKYRKYVHVFILVECLNILALFFSNKAISQGPVSLVRILEGFQPIYVLLFAIIFYPFFPKYFREGMTKNKTLKFSLMGLMLVGLYFINL